ncbi:MAG: hypothetical protein IPK58_21570 [Acidobacteria bacterium]|nr:hypothetical protein [Acidobacteriota bacterium]
MFDALTLGFIIFRSSSHIAGFGGDWLSMQFLGIVVVFASTKFRLP